MLDDLVGIERLFPDRETIYIHPIYDLHTGSKQFNPKRWETFVRQVEKSKNHYLILGGDLHDNALKDSVSDSYGARLSPSEQKKYVVETLKPVRDRILCITTGNHEARSKRAVDDDPMYDVADKLDLEDIYRENACFLYIKFGDRSGTSCGQSNPVYSIMATHGAGGGMYIGSGANRLERYGAIIDGLDIIITGHTHKPINFPDGKLVMDPANNSVRTRNFYAVVASSWLEYGGYPITKLYPPTAMVKSTITLTGNKKHIKVDQEDPDF